MCFLAKFLALASQTIFCTCIAPSIHVNIHTSCQCEVRDKCQNNLYYDISGPVIVWLQTINAKQEQAAS